MSAIINVLRRDSCCWTVPVKVSCGLTHFCKELCSHSLSNECAFHPCDTKFTGRLFSIHWSNATCDLLSTSVRDVFSWWLCCFRHSYEATAVLKSPMFGRFIITSFDVCRCKFRKILLMDEILGRLSFPHTFSKRNFSRISQAYSEWFCSLYSMILRITTGVETRGLLPPAMKPLFNEYFN